MGSTVSVGSLSGSFVEKVTFRISGSGEISSSQYIQKSDGQVTGSKINFTGGRISGSDMTIFANEFDFKSPAGRVQGNETTFEISSSLLNLTPTKLDVKGNIQAERVYGQDTFLAGKIVKTGVKNPTITSVKYSLPFVEAYSKDGNDVRLGSETDGFMMGQSYNPSTTAKLVHTGSVIVGNHQSFTLGGAFSTSPQFLTKVTNDGIGYPEEFKSWKDISGVNNDYVFVENSDATTAARASGSLPTQLIGNQLVFNQVTSSKLIFNAVNAKTASNAFSTIETDNINLQDILSSKSVGTHLQFAMRGTAHPSTGSFSGFNPEYKVEVNVTSGSTSDTVWEKSYKDTKATNASWTVFDVPLTDIVTTWTSESKYNQHQYEFSRATQPPPSGSDVYGVKVKISSRYSGSVKMPQRFQEGKRFGGRNLASGSFTLGFALTEMRMVEPVRIPALDVQNLHLKDTYLTWHDNPSTTGHYGNFVPEHRLENTTSSFALGSKNDKWDELYLNLKQDNIVSSSFSGSGGLVTQKENKFVRMDVHSGKLSFTSASAGGGGSSYSHPTHPGDDINIDTTALTGATVISDLDFNITTDTSGHVTDANGTVATRTLTLANLGYTGVTNANNFTYSLPLGSSSTRGGFKIGFAESGRNYPVEVSSEKMYVNVPWTDTVTINTNNYLDGITKSGNTLTFSVNGTTNKTYTFGSNAFNSTSYLTSLPSHTHDDRYYTETEMQTFFNRGYINHQQANNLSVGWYTIAQNTGDRALGEFQIWDIYSSRHQSVIFNAAHHFGIDDSNSITVSANSSYGTDVFRYIRIKENGTYDGAAIQIYIDNANNDSHVAIVGANAQESGWVLVDWLADSESPSLISNWSSASEKSKIDLDIVHTGGIATTGKIYAGGATSQYEVYHTNNLTPLTIGTTSTTALAGNTTIPSISGLLPKSGGTMTGGIAMGNQNITGINTLIINDPGPTEGISWSGGNTKIVESPNDLTTNSAGNLQFVYDGTRRMSITNTGAEVNGAFTVSGLTGTGNRMVIANASGVLSTQAIPSGGGGSGTITGNGAVNRVPYYSGTTSLSNQSTFTYTAQSGKLNVGNIALGAGSTTAPSIYFSGQSNTGLYFTYSPEQMYATVNGTTVAQWMSTGYKVVSGALGVNVNPSGTDGRIDASNDIVAYSTSDERLKENVSTIKASLSKVLQIRGVEFDWKPLTEEEKKTIHGNEGHDVGVIAQEIEKVLPEVVTERENGYKAVRYEKIVPLLIEAIKEQSDTIEKLTERINKLEKGSNN